MCGDVTKTHYLKNKEELAEIRKRGMQFANDTSWEREGDKVVAAVKKGIEEELAISLNMSINEINDYKVIIC